LEETARKRQSIKKSSAAVSKEKTYVIGKRQLRYGGKEKGQPIRNCTRDGKGFAVSTGGGGPSKSLFEKDRRYLEKGGVPIPCGEGLSFYRDLKKTSRLCEQEKAAKNRGGFEHGGRGGPKGVPQVRQGKRIGLFQEGGVVILFRKEVRAGSKKRVTGARGTLTLGKREKRRDGGVREEEKKKKKICAGGKKKRKK